MAQAEKYVFPVVREPCNRDKASVPQRRRAEAFPSPSWTEKRKSHPKVAFH